MVKSLLLPNNPNNGFRTPGQLLEEVLLVDDFSDRPELGSGLENYIKIFRGSVRYFSFCGLSSE